MHGDQTRYGTFEPTATPIRQDEVLMGTQVLSIHAKHFLQERNAFARVATVKMRQTLIKQPADLENVNSLFLQLLSAIKAKPNAPLTNLATNASHGK